MTPEEQRNWDAIVGMAARNLEEKFKSGEMSQEQYVAALKRLKQAYGYSPEATNN